MDKNDNLTHALQYREAGFGVIPVGPNKKPRLKWEPYQKEKASEFDIKKWWIRWPDSMIGIVTGSISGICVIDIDTPQGKAAIDEILPDSLITPTASTPRGGQHLYFQMPDEDLRNNAGAIPGVDFRGNGGYVVVPPSKNDSGVTYEWLHGLSLLDVSLAPLPDRYKDMLKKNIQVFAHRTGVTDATNLPRPPEFFTEGRRNEDLFTVANSLITTRIDVALVAQALDMLGSTCIPPLEPPEIQAITKSAIDRAGRREMTLVAEITEWIESQTGHFQVSECHKDLGLITRNHKHNAAVIFQRLANPKKHPIIERYGHKSGCYRPIQSEYSPMDIAAASGKPIADFRYPLNIEEHARTYPKNVVCVSGFSNQGKSAFAFEIARMNSKLFPNRKVRFQSAEAGEDEIKEKLMFYPQDTPKLSFDWWMSHVDFIESYEGWWDKIDPDGLNIVDYISDYKEAFKIADYIKEIHQKLNKGVAVVIIQRDPNKPNPAGGQATRHVARLSIDIEFKKIILQKVKGAIKQPPHHRHPDGLMRRFELQEVWKLVPTSEWYWPDDEARYSK